MHVNFHCGQNNKRLTCDEVFLQRLCHFEFLLPQVGNAVHPTSEFRGGHGPVAQYCVLQTRRDGFYYQRQSPHPQDAGQDTRRIFGCRRIVGQLAKIPVSCSLGVVVLFVWHAQRLGHASTEVAGLNDILNFLLTVFFNGSNAQNIPDWI